MATELDLSGLTDSNRTYLSLLEKSGQKPRWITNLFGKDYMWFEDPESRRWYLEQLEYKNGPA